MLYQKNFSSGLNYQGKNQGTLLAVKEEQKFKSNFWLTFLQAKDKKLKIKKGSKSVAIFRGFGQAEQKDKDGKIKTVSVPMGFARVFNLDQTEEYKNK